MAACPKEGQQCLERGRGRAAGHSGTDFWPWGGCGSPAASDSSRQPALSCSWGESGLLRTNSASGGTPSCPAQGRPWPKPEVLSLTPNQAGGQVLGARSWERQRLGLQVLAHPNRSGQSAAPEGLAVLLGAARGRDRTQATPRRVAPSSSHSSCKDRAQPESRAAGVWWPHAALSPAVRSPLCL